MSHFVDLVQDRLWAIHPEKLDEINALIERLIVGHKLSDFPEFVAPMVEVMQATGSRKIVVIPMIGSLMKRANLFTRVSGGTSYEIVRGQLDAAMKDGNVASVVLKMDSPGGTVDGVFELANAIHEYRGTKPIIAHSDGMVASAAQLIASAADELVVGEATMAGSIGVVGVHYDLSKKDEKEGIKRTYIYSGKFKATGNDAEPLSREGKEYLQARSDYFYQLFTEKVAKFRNVTVDKVLADMADGRVFIGQQAVDVGLADRVGTVESVIDSLKGRVLKMDEKELKVLQAKAEAQEKELAEMKAREQETAAALAELKQAREERAKLELQLKRQGFQSMVEKKASEFNLEPVKVAAAVSLLMALDGAKVTVEGNEMSATECFEKNFLSGQPVIPSAEEDFAQDGKKAPTSDEEAVKMASDIAEIANRGLPQ